MYNNNSGGPGGGWTPGMGMPPLGFGVVAQQPGGNRMMNAGQQVPAQAQQMAHWQQQQFMAAQMGLASAAVGVQPIAQHQPQQQGFHQYQQSQQLYAQQQYQQQHWMETQKKAAEEQKKYYDQMMKQRQFDEQKMRLRAFGNTKKTGVSADSMIQNILGPKDYQKPKSPPAPKKVTENEATTSNAALSFRQGTAVDWSKMNNVETLFTPPQETAALQPASHAPVANACENTPPGQSLEASGVTAKPGLVNPSATSGAGSSQGVPYVKPSDPAVSAGAVASGIGGSAAPSKKPMGKPIPVPAWLSDKANIPAVYKHAGSLVEGKDGWVDTSRAYMLLMKTGLPPPFLGILWEMVNRTQPGQLLEQEFTTLLALVALVQTGLAITSVDVLSATSEPVLPIIDHPALMPLVQDYIQQRQQIQQQQLQEQQQQLQEQQQQLQEPGSETKPTTNDDDDEFEDFVSGPTPDSGLVGNAAFENTQGSNAGNVSVMAPAQPLIQPSVTTNNQLSVKPLPTTVDKMKRMNLPEVGFSPELSPSTSFDHAQDDDFDDFQSAAPINAGSAAAASSSSSVVNPPAVQLSAGTSLPTENVNKSSSSQDKYAVFRELESVEDSSGAGNASSLPHDPANHDDSFGDFCSNSEPVSLALSPSTFPPIVSSNTAGSGTSNTTPVSIEVFSTPPEAPESSVDCQFEADFGVFNSASSQQPTNYADIHEAMKRVEEEQKQKTADSWIDPFGEFEDAGSSSLNAAQPVPQLNIASSVDDDDFGDFMGPDGGAAEPDSLSFSQPFPRLSEPLGETQSVASLELPGLEMTVGLQASESRGSGSGQSPDLFIQARSEMSGVEDQLRGLTLDAPTISSDVHTLGGGGGVSPNGNSSSGITPSTGAVMDSFSGGFMDKYSIIREEAAKNTYDEAHTGSWERCLEAILKLLEVGSNITKILDKKLKSQVLATSQMQDYLANLQEVWFVCERISKSSQHVTTSIKVDQLLSQAKTLWEEILLDSENGVSKPSDGPEGENQMSASEVCGVCLSGGGSKLTYGGHSYHPPCANLWLNCVDLLLPSLTPVTLL